MQPLIEKKHVPSSVLATTAKLSASESVHPGSLVMQLPSSVPATESKLSASASVQPSGM